MMYFDLVGLVLVKSGERTAGPSNVNGQKKLGKKVEITWQRLREFPPRHVPCATLRCAGQEAEICLEFDSVFS